MNIKGIIAGITKDWQSQKFQITLQMDEGNIQEINSLIGKALSIELKLFRNKRSKDANALLWECLGRLANHTGADKWDLYLGALKDYGQYTHTWVRPDAIEAMKKQWREIQIIGNPTQINGELMVPMLCYFGSHTYNTQEFSKLLDGVIAEMKDAGIEAPTSQDMQRSLDLWEKAHEKTQ